MLKTLFAASTLTLAAACFTPALADDGKLVFQRIAGHQRDPPAAPGIGSKAGHSRLPISIQVSRTGMS